MGSGWYIEQKVSAVIKDLQIVSQFFRQEKFSETRRMTLGVDLCT
jgi:hypothetical protein